MSIARRIAVAVAIVGSAVTPLTTSAQRASPGYTYHLRVTDRVTRPNGRTTDYLVMAGNAMVTEHGGRFDIDEAARESGALTQKGRYILYDTASMTIVAPKDRQIVRFSLENLERGLAAGGIPGTSVKITDVAVNFESLGAGEPMLGMATTKYRITQDYKVAAKMASTNRNSTEHIVQDLWMADAPKSLGNPFARLLLFRAGPGSGFGEILTRTAEARGRMGRGVPLKTVTTSTSTSSRNEVTQTVTTMEVSDLHAENVDDDILVTPADYQAVDVAESSRTAPSGPGAQAAQPAKVARPAAGDNAAAEAKQGFVKTLHGMGRRP